MTRSPLRAAAGLLLTASLALAQTPPPGQVRHAPSVRGTVEGSLIQVGADKWPALPAVPRPTQKALVKISGSDQAIDWRTLRNLTLASGVGQVAVPAGTYGDFRAEAGSGFTLGTAGAIMPAVYNFQNLALNGASKLLVAGPVVINVAGGFNASSTVGNQAHPPWLTLNIRSGGLILGTGARFFGEVVAPGGTLIINYGAQFTGGLTVEDLTVNGGGVLRLVTLRVPNVRPTVTLVAPAPASTYAAPATIQLAATAADEDGAVAKVEFFRGEVLVGEDTNAPYELTLTDVTPGSHALFARATDNTGETADSAMVTVAVTNPNQNPTISLTAPVDGAMFTSPPAVTVAATAGDSDGSVVRVDFFQDEKLIGSDTAAPFEFNTGTLAAGSYVFSAVAVDNGGSTTTSTTATVRVMNANEPPTIAITSPAGGTIYDAPAAFAVTARAADPDGSVAKVTFLLNGVVQREDMTAPYDAGVSGLAPGTFELVARVTDNLGATTDSAPVRVTVVHVNHAPVAAGQSLSTDEDTALAITLGATDTDDDPVTFTLLTLPSSGTLAGSPPSVTYTPRLNFNGTDSFTFKASDKAADSPATTVSITVRPVNDPPMARPASLTVAEDTPGRIQLSGDDVDSAPLRFAIIANPEHGTLSGTPPDLTYTPAAGYHGADKFVYAAFDGEFISPAALAIITVTSVNQAPTAESGAFATEEGVPVAVTLVGKDNDEDKQELIYRITTDPAHGTLSGTAPNLVYTPAAHYHGTDAIAFTVSDGRAVSAEATIALSVSSRNDPPVAQSQSISTMEDTSANVMLSAADPDGDDLTYSVVTPPAHGTITGIAPNLVYEPAADFHGTDTFEFKAGDGTADSAIATITVSVTPVNDAPTAGELNLELKEDESANFDLPASDPDGDSLHYEIVIAPAHGALSGTAPHLTYAPEADFHGDDEFAYKVTDGTNDSTPAFVRLRVAPVNDAPKGEDFTITLAAGTSVTFELRGSDIDSDQLTFEVEDMPAHGGLSVLEPSLIYTPVPDFKGKDTMTYTVGDGTLVSAINTITFDVKAAEGPPAADPKSFSTDEDTPVSITLTGSDPDGDSLTYAVTTPPSHGTLTETSPGSFSYMPESNFHGADGFAYVAKDATAASPPANVTLSVAAVNDVPVTSGQSVTTPEDTRVSISLAGADVDGDALTYVITTSPTHGSLQETAPGTFVYQPAPGYHGPDAFAYVAKDQASESTSATVSVEVTSVNHAPRASDQTASTDEDMPLSVTLSATDPDGGPLNYAIQTSPAHGTLSGQAPDLLYTPDANYHGSDSFTFTASDGTLSTGTVTVSLAVNSVDDAPTASAQLVVTHEDTAVAITLAGSDVEGDALTFAITTAPTHGTLSDVSPGIYSYLPAPNYHGPDAFEFVARDQSGQSVPAVVNVQVTPENDAPVAAELSVTADEDTALPITLVATDVDGDALMYTLQAAPSHGTLAGTAPDVVYTPAANYNGPDFFSFAASDGSLSTGETAVTVTVKPINDVPVAKEQSVTTVGGADLTVNLTAEDVDGDELVYVITIEPAHGTLRGTGPNRTYTPSAGFTGGDEFAFTAGDGHATSEPALISITVTAPAEQPAEPAKSSDEPVAPAPEPAPTEPTPSPAAPPEAGASEAEKPAPEAPGSGTEPNKTE
ncbi:MAG TPA: Ig-like domain-containing protein [Lacunisphaera sp.]|nr:Ig-like domain-containing protein [Lacunisphaera sp.]